MEYCNRRSNAEFKSEARFFRPDDGCTYAETYTIDLSEVTSLVALYPSPDNTVSAKSIEEGEGLRLDGCFIGACTTAHEDLILGALVLEVAMNTGLKPDIPGHRKVRLQPNTPRVTLTVAHPDKQVTPGSRQIVQSLENTGLLDIYRKAGFQIGVPGCSYCVGLGADKAADGEVWLSSQNRNFKNR